MGFSARIILQREKTKRPPSAFVDKKNFWKWLNHSPNEIFPVKRWHIRVLIANLQDEEDKRKATQEPEHDE